MSKDRKKEEILKNIHDGKADIIWLWFVDILGQLKGVALTPREIERTIVDGAGFDGSSIEGFARIQESDLMAIPDLDTFAWLPAADRNSGSREARMFCDLQMPDGEPYPGDPRGVLRRQLDRIRKSGYTMYVGTEMEYFYFDGPDPEKFFDRTGYFDASIMNRGTFLRQRTLKALEEMGIECEFAHHEVAPSQHEIDLHYDEALRMADRVLSARFIVKEIAREHEAHATFMPKPVAGINGSGMHLHQSIFRDDENLFFAKDDDYNLSPFAYAYLAGILNHVKCITLVLNQFTNSYKRLVPGYEAPVYISWGQKNRSALVRVPRVRIGRERSSRIELRSPDPVCNPYLAFASMLAAGMDGVEKGMKPPSSIEENIYEMAPLERSNRDIGILPEDLFEAIREARKSELLRDVLGDHIFEKFIENKYIEWDRYRIQITRWEIDQYFTTL
ncbi:MAG: glutamine synthetase family protein [Pseudomonadota bacterium]